jgi:alcohol dehydrogenase class IV
VHWDQIIKTIVENKEVVAAFLVSLIAIIKLTAWGKAQSSALDTITGIIERIGAGEIKSRVAKAEADLSTAARDAVQNSVAKADPKKTPKSAVIRFLKEVFRVL